MIKILKEFFSDNNGRASSIRLLSAIVVIDMMFVWTILSLKECKLLEFGWDNAAILLSSLGIKTWQKKYEKEEECCEK